MSDSIPLSIPHLSGNEWAYVKQCLDENAVAAAGTFLGRFEKSVSEYVGAPHAVAIVNGTAALHLAMRVVGVEPGDEVIVPDFTFVAAVNVVRYCGAIPVLLDVDRETATLDPRAVERFLREECMREGDRVVNRRTKRRVHAIIPVHLYGHPADLDPIWKLAREFGLVVVEDAAECLGAKYRGVRVGSKGDIACLSFNGNKVITTGCGGMVLSGRKDWVDRCRHLSTQARAHPTDYIHDEIGHNYRMPNLNAALGVAQMECLERYLQKKRRIADRYLKAGLPLLREAEWAWSSCWLNTILVDRPGEIGAALRKQGIECRRVWPPVHRQTPYRECPVYSTEGADWLFDRGLNIPSSVGLEDSQLDRVVEALRKVSL